MRSNEKSVSASARVSIRQRRQGIVTQVTSDTSGVLGAGRPSETTSTREAQRSEAVVGLGRLFRKLLSEGEQAVQEQELSSQASHVPDPALLDAIERSLLAAKHAKGECLECGGPTDGRHRLCDRHYVASKL